MAELLLISSPLTAERQLDVVFVHGLGGDPIDTWRSGTDGNTSWPHWLALEFGSKIGVWTLGYAAAPTRMRGLRASLFGSQDPDAGAAMSLPRRAENALDRLVGAGIGNRPVCFITHSLGGLLVKSILRRAADSASAPERLQMAEQCRGVLFLATPHHGSRLAKLASAFKLYFPTVSTLDLKDNDDHLMDLYEWYRDYAPSHKIHTRSYYENKEVKGVVIVVPRSSADPGVTGETARGPTPLDRDHLEISKPRNRNDQAYLGSTQLIRLILMGALPETAPTEASALGASDTVANKYVTDAIISEKPLLDLVIGENRTLEQALDAVRFINSQMNPNKKARLVYIEEGSTHLFIDGPEETLRRIQELYRYGELQKLLADPETLRMLTILSVELTHDKKALDKAALINDVMDMRVSKNELIGSDLSGANLSGANLSGANLSGADLSGADLSWANLSRVNLSRVNLSGAILSGANLSWTDLYQAILRRAGLQHANLLSAVLCGANLNEADLSGANLNGADLSKAGFIGAKLTKADFTSAILVSSKFERNVGLTKTQIIDMQSRGALFVGPPESGVPSLMR